MPRTVNATFYGIFVDLFSLAISSDAWSNASTDPALRTIKMVLNRLLNNQLESKEGLFKISRIPPEVWKLVQLELWKEKLEKADEELCRQFWMEFGEDERDEAQESSGKELYTWEEIFKHDFSGMSSHSEFYEHVPELLIHIYKGRILGFLKAHGLRWIHRRPTKYTLFSFEGEPNKSPSVAIALRSIESPRAKPLEEEDSKDSDDSDDSDDFGAFDTCDDEEDDDEEDSGSEEIKDVDTQQTRQIAIPENAQPLFHRFLTEYCITPVDKTGSGKADKPGWKSYSFTRSLF
ncbi:hypothetical protein JCM3765_004415 [Sporobolomyces pararoseus]